MGHCQVAVTVTRHQLQGLGDGGVSARLDSGHLLKGAQPGLLRDG